MISKEIRERLTSAFRVACLLGLLPLDWHAKTNQLKPCKSRFKLLANQAGVVGGIYVTFHCTLGFAIDLYFKNLTIEESFMMAALIGCAAFIASVVFFMSACAGEIASSLNSAL